MTSREKAIEAIEKIFNFEIFIDDWKVFLSYINEKSITIGDIIDGNLSDELLTIYDVIEQPTIDDAIKVVEKEIEDWKFQGNNPLFVYGLNQVLTAIKGLK